jgi:hypothetical protein
MPDSFQPAPPALPLPRLDAARAFADLFLFVLALAAAQFAAATLALRPVPLLLLLAAAHVPAARALFHLYRLPPAAATPRSGLFFLLLASLFLSPFLVWWRAFPGTLWFAANLVPLALVRMALLLRICRLVARWARANAEPGLRLEAGLVAGLLLFLWLLTAGVIAAACFRSGLYRHGWDAVSLHLSLLTPKARLAFILPDAAVLSMLAGARGIALQPPPR